MATTSPSSLGSDYKSPLRSPLKHTDNFLDRRDSLLSANSRMLSTGSYLDTNDKNNSTVKIESKSRCGLCKLWFEKSSVNFKIPNHRILELQSCWNLNVTAMRFKTASYLYTTSNVCLYCTQFFSDPNKVTDPKADNSRSNTGSTHHADDIIQFDSKPVQIITTAVVRSNVALEKHTYQSSVVDNLISDYALQPPYERGCRTRLEADPWWEVDLGQPTNLYSVAFNLVRKKSQSTAVFVLLLDGPVGFENPFLDELRARCIACKEFVLPRASSSAGEDPEVTWTLPEITLRKIRAVRIQIRGMSALHLLSFKATQGDSTEEEEGDADVNELGSSSMSEILDDGSVSAITLGTFANAVPSNAGAFAAIPISTIKKDLKKARRWNLQSEAARPKTPAEISAAASASKAAALKAVEQQLKEVQAQYAAQSRWKLRATKACDYFESAPFRQNFILNTPPHKASSAFLTQPPRKASSVFLTQLPPQTEAVSLAGSQTTSSVSSNAGSGKLLVALRDLIFNTAIDIIDASSQQGIRVQDIRNNALMQTEPRCSLASLFQRLRLVLHWMHSKQNTKEVEVLSRYEAFHSLSTPISVLEGCLGNLAQVFLYLDTGQVEPPTAAFLHYDKGSAQKRKESAFSMTSATLSLSKPSLLGAVLAHSKMAHNNNNNQQQQVSDEDSLQSAFDKSKGRSCSWSQFLVIMELFCTQRTGRIIQEAFLEDPKPFLSQLGNDDLNRRTASMGPAFVPQDTSSSKKTKKAPRRGEIPIASRETVASRMRSREVIVDSLSLSRSAPAGLRSQEDPAGGGVEAQLSKLSHSSRVSTADQSLSNRYKRGLVLMRPLTSKECRERMSTILHRLDLPDANQQLALEFKCATQLGTSSHFSGASLTLPLVLTGDSVFPGPGSVDSHLSTEELGIGIGIGSPSRRLADVRPEKSEDDVFARGPSSSSRQLSRQFSIQEPDLGRGARSPLLSPEPRTPATLSGHPSLSLSPALQSYSGSSHNLANNDATSEHSLRSRKDVGLTSDWPHSSSLVEAASGAAAGAGTSAFLKRCLLCERKFPSDVLDTRVMYKHVEHLRRGLRQRSELEESECAPAVSVSMTVTVTEDAFAQHPSPSTNTNTSPSPSATKELPQLGKDSRLPVMAKRSSRFHLSRQASGLSAITSATGTATATGTELDWDWEEGAQPDTDGDGAEGEAAATNMSVYRTVAVCRFCSQFFDPDFPGGVSFPSKQSLIEYRKEVQASDGNQMLQCFDQRYLLTTAWSLRSDAQARQSRSAARRALEVYRATSAGRASK